MAYDDMVKYSHSMKAGDNKTLNRFWISVESFLVASANISKILWPSRPDKCSNCKFQPQLPHDVSTRRENLRTLLSLDDSSPIKSRRFRNHFEHYDNRIEEWTKEYENKIIIDSNIGPVDLVLIGEERRTFFMRNFDQ